MDRREDGLTCMLAGDSAGCVHLMSNEDEAANSTADNSVLPHPRYWEPELSLGSRV